MLLALYTRAEQLLVVMQSAAENELPVLKVKLSKVLMGIRQGLDFQYGELPQNIERLCAFIQQQVWEGDAQQWDACQRILGTVREGFEGIRDQAADLERAGEIPPVAQDSTMGRVV